MKTKTSFTFLRGLQEHIDHAEALNLLRRDAGQDGNASTDPVWFAINSIDSRRRPWTILMFDEGVPAGAVLLREQMRYGLPLGYFFACDAAGDEFVIAPRGAQQRCLRLCLEAMTSRYRSAVVFLATQADYSGLGWKDLKSGVGEGVALYRLPLLADWDTTLEQFGKHTRRNLRYYSRNAIRYGATFLPDLTQAEEREAGAQLRQHSDYAVSERVLHSVEQAIGRLEGGFSAGLRSPTGEWLSILYGWRTGTKCSVFLQINHTDYRKSSLSTAMRALLIRHEIQRGGSDLVFVSYSNALIERGCARDIRHDLLIARPSWRLALLRALSGYLPAGHRLRQVLERSRADVRAGGRKLGDVRPGP